MADVIVVEWDARWAARAERMVALLKEDLPSPARIEHIGSTAVAQMAAKDVIDLQASVDDLNTASRAFDRPLAALGFKRSPYEVDHVPEGCADAPEQWAKRLWTRRGHPGGEVNLHVRRIGSANERLALLFRDWFRAHPEAVSSYGAFKRSLAAVVTDLGVYSDAKDPVVDLVIAVAEPWAVASGWSPQPTNLAAD